MGGTNPYIDAAEQALPQKPYRITFVAGEEETAARIRNDKVTPPLVWMALLFMALIIYPALNLQ